MSKNTLNPRDKMFDNLDSVAKRRMWFGFAVGLALGFAIAGFVAQALV